MTIPTPPGPPPVPPPPPLPVPFVGQRTNDRHLRGVGNRALSIRQLVEEAHLRGASDIHIRVGEEPRFRIRGEMFRVGGGCLPVTPEHFEGFLSEILSPEQQQRFAYEKELDTAIFYEDFLRCRVNCFDSLRGGAMVLRLIPLTVPSIDELGLPEVLKRVASQPQGLVLVTGPTGSGKSTTLAAMVRHLNETASRHIVCIEDPIEYVYSSDKCLISQREVGLHTHEFSQALRSVLREDPDVILIGEMRDRETVDTALKAAQTGHLVLGTLHTRNAIGTLDRLLNIYTPDEQAAMRFQIMESLVGVIAQTLVPTTDGKRTAAMDILVNTPAVRDYLLKGEDDEVRQLMESDTLEGMQVLNQMLCDLVLDGRITITDGIAASSDEGDLKRRIRNEGFDPGRSSNHSFENLIRR
ncbi:type IV pilus twitching motility protein PilT [Leptolyngbya sp. FACHB-261]|uniref:type IV pilus twitching motility protein PilT n=1 Tax=Leptolyngbya sp. FACHB-261 TaxID=2692806 RepID=UPI00168805F6|nr:type IV pilus twitching motility protein PilT [Leptolyngbya sp. FACHB-261]MBD2103824.1 type IV pilus twitching motility protein PilT [Leptolyngbya sp. FACHB-261]